MTWHESHNEREFQTKVDQLLASFAGKAEVDLLFHEEYTLATGRADTVYNRLIIEYEEYEPRAPSELISVTSERRTPSGRC